MSITARPGGADSEQSRQRVEGALVREHGLVGRPPIAREKPRHYAIPAATVPHQNRPRLQDPREFPDHANIIRGMRKKSERCEQVEHGVEAPGPLTGKFAHVATGVAQVGARSASARDREHLPRIVEAIDIIASLGKQMRVTALPARYVEDSGSNRQPKDLDETGHFAPVALGSEERFVLEEIVGVKRGFPPLAALSQKNTGSR